MFYVDDQGFGGVASLDMNNVTLFNALLTSRDILLEDLQKISKAVNEALDISEFVSIMSNMKLLNSVLQANQFPIDVEVLGQGQPQDGLKVLVFISCYRVILFCFAFILFLRFFLLNSLFSSCVGRKWSSRVSK